jgi:hypothetical protein
MPIRPFSVSLRFLNLVASIPDEKVAKKKKVKMRIYTMGGRITVRVELPSPHVAQHIAPRFVTKPHVRR